MKQEEFVNQLRVCAATLKPLTRDIPTGAQTWNGVAYVEYTGASLTPDPYALAWQSMLKCIAEMLEAQATPLTFKQKEYLQSLLFGGMGSLNDISFVSKRPNDIEAQVNNRLREEHEKLYAMFTALKVTGHSLADT